jgi:hypothetical protein
LCKVKGAGFRMWGAGCRVNPKDGKEGPCLPGHGVIRVGSWELRTYGSGGRVGVCSLSKRRLPSHRNPRAPFVFTSSKTARPADLLVGPIEFQPGTTLYITGTAQSSLEYPRTSWAPRLVPPCSPAGPARVAYMLRPRGPAFHLCSPFCSEPHLCYPPIRKIFVKSGELPGVGQDNPPSNRKHSGNR